MTCPHTNWAREAARELPRHVVESLTIGTKPGTKIADWKFVDHLTPNPAGRLTRECDDCRTAFNDELQPRFDAQFKLTQEEIRRSRERMKKEGLL